MISLRFFHASALGAALLLLASVAAPASPVAKKSHGGTGAFSWDNAVVHIEVSGIEYSYAQPWTRAPRKVDKTGVAIAGHQIITTAEGLNDQTVIRLQKQGGGLFSAGSVVWIDYQSNLAAVTTDEAGFWNGIQPAELADPVVIPGDVHILRWDGDRLENRPGNIERMTVDNSALSFVSVPALKVDSTISSAVSGEAVTRGNQLLGLASGQDSDVVTAVPSSFISSIVNARKHGNFTGLGYFDFTWEPVQNPLSLQYLKLPGATRGVIVKDTGLKPGVTSLVKSGDVILQIDGFNIDAEGDYDDPQYGKMTLENLSSRGKWAGQTCQMKIWRDGQVMDITYKLPLAEYSDELVAEQSFDHAPQYVMTGGLVFVRLTDAYLRSFGADWRQRAPFRLGFYETGKVKPDRKERVVLSEVLPDKINLGYELLHNEVIDQVNGRKISVISDLYDALKSPINGFDVFKFAPGEPMETVVLDASEVDAASQAIMTKFHIIEDHVLRTDEAAAAAPSQAAASSTAPAPPR
jgi:hypothetical protein